MKKTAWAFLLPAITAMAAEQPNVLLIFPDQLQRTVLSCYGGIVDTPNIDRLAREGVQFTEATCPTPFCSPSRMSLATGLHPHQHGVVQNVGGRQRGMSPDERTYPRTLWEDGYANHHFGKWHLEPNGSGTTVPWFEDLYRLFPEYYDQLEDQFEEFKSRGEGKFGKWYNFVFPVELSDELKSALDHNDLWNQWQDHWAGQMVLGMGRIDLPLGDCFDYRVADKAIASIEKYTREETPFLINIGFNVPHDPYIAPKEYYDQFPLEEIEMLPNAEALHERFKHDWARHVNVATRGPDGEEWGMLEFMRVYYANVKFLDDQVGRVLDALEKSGQMDNTIIVFISDHGDMAGGHGMTWKETVAFYEEVATIPMIIRYPKALDPQVNKTPASIVDVFPTVFDLLGREQLPGIAGKSLVPYMTGAKQPEEAFPYTFSARIIKNPDAEREILPEMVGHFMVRGKGFKYMVYSQRPDDPRWAKEFKYNAKPVDILFHLERDPGETVDLAHDPEFDTVKKEMNQALQEWLEQTGWKGQPVMHY
jgi:arylsulfatase A-like enzyme